MNGIKLLVISVAVFLASASADNEKTYYARWKNLILKNDNIYMVNTVRKIIIFRERSVVTTSIMISLILSALSIRKTVL